MSTKTSLKDGNLRLQSAKIWIRKSTLFSFYLSLHSHGFGMSSIQGKAEEGSPGGNVMVYVSLSSEMLSEMLQNQILYFMCHSEDRGPRLFPTLLGGLINIERTCP
jgi:hypothetical protein